MGLAAINAGINAAYTAYLLQGAAAVPLFSDLGVGRDLALTPMVIAMLSALLGTAAARAKLGDGRVTMGEVQAPDMLRVLPSGIVARSLFLAVLAGSFLATPMWLALQGTNVVTLSLAAAVGLKVAITIFAALADVYRTRQPRFVL